MNAPIQEEVKAQGSDEDLEDPEIAQEHYEIPCPMTCENSKFSVLNAQMKKVYSHLRVSPEAISDKIQISHLQTLFMNDQTLSKVNELDSQV